MEEQQKTRAKCLYTIAGYYSKIGIADQTGDVLITYGDYWRDLTSLTEGNLVLMDNERTALIVYEEIISQMISKVAEFRRDGVSLEEILQEIAKIRKHLRDDFADTNVKKEDLENLEEALKQAERLTHSAFQQSIQGGNSSE